VQEFDTRNVTGVFAKKREGSVAVLSKSKVVGAGTREAGRIGLIVQGGEGGVVGFEREVLKEDKRRRHTHSTGGSVNYT